MTLQPTYKLQWGSAGSSNALDIAQALGFDQRVLSEARILARAELGKQQQQEGRMEQVGRDDEARGSCNRLIRVATKFQRCSAPALSCA